MTERLIAFLIFAPVVFGLLALVCGNVRVRQFVVTLAALVTMAAGVLLAREPQGVYTVPAIWSSVGLALDALVVMVVVAIGWRIRSRLIWLMSLAQLVLLGAGTVLTQHDAPAAPAMVLDTLSIIMVLIISIVGSLICIYAPSYMVKHAAHSPASPFANRWFFCVLVAFLGMMNGLVLADQFSWLSFFWEATTLCSFFLIGHDGTVEAKASARRALLINTFGGLAMALASFLVILRGGEETLSGLIASKALLPVALLCLATMTKAAQLPFQSWLLGAMVAPTPVSALLHSSTMVKAGSYLILRLAPGFLGTRLAPVVAVAGAFTFAVACALAIGQSNGKKVLAYSTIANLGLIMACAGINTPLALAAALMLLCFHALSKALLFLCVGTIEQTIGSRHIEDMSGILFKMPLTTNVAILGMVSMMLPPFGMLIGKWMAMESAVHAPPVLVLLVAGSAFTVFFWAKWLGRITTASYHPVYKVEKTSGLMLAVLMVMAVGVLAGALAAMPLYRMVFKPASMAAFALNHGDTALWSLLESVESASFYLAWPLLVLIGVVGLAIAISMARFRPSHVRLPFLCGENIENVGETFRFRSLMDSNQLAMLTSYYLSPIFGEGVITAWSNPVAVLIILTLFGVLII